MLPITVTVGPLSAAVANSIAHSATPSAGPITLTASPVVLDKPRQALITTTGDESGNTFTILGTNWAGDSITEVVTGVNNGTVASVLSYATVISINIASNAANALTIGTNGVAYSPWARMDGFASTPISIQCNVTGTVNYTVQGSMDDPNSPTNPVAAASMTWINNPDMNLVGNTASAQGALAFIPSWVRVLLNSGSGSVSTTFLQSGTVQY